MNKNKLKGFSLIEVLVFTTIVSIFFVAAATIVSYMIRVSKVNEHKIIATRHAEELLEWLRAERDIDWNAFTAYADSPTTYCVNSSSLTAATVWNITSCSYTLNTIFKRTVTLTPTKVSGYTSQVDVDVVVEWDEGGTIYKVPLSSTFSVWEQY